MMGQERPADAATPSVRHHRDGQDFRFRRDHIGFRLVLTRALAEPGK